MSDRSIKIPGPEHPIKISASRSRLLVTLNDMIVADTRNALVMDEALYPRVFYIPRSDVSMGMLERSNHATYCPFKGDCAYYSLPAGGERGLNAVWTYEDPFEWMLEIKGMLAFYSDRVDIKESHV